MYSDNLKGSCVCCAVYGKPDPAARPVRKKRTHRRKGRGRHAPVQKRHIKVMDLILALEGTAIAAFTVAVLWIFRKTGSEPAALIYSFFGVMGVETGIMGWIKNAKERERALAAPTGEKETDKDRQTEQGGELK